MRKTTAEGAAKTAVLDAGRTGKGRDLTNLPFWRSCFAAGVKARSWIADILLSGPPAFRTLMLGSSISMFGSRISTVAFPMLVLRFYDSPFLAGLVAFVAIAPSMLAYMPAGALVDRWNPWRVMLVSELLRGVAIGLVVVSLAVFGRRTNIWFLIFAMGAEEILEIFSTLADRRYLIRLMERDNIASRQASIEVRTHATGLAGRPVGAFLFAIQPILPFLADAESFLFSICSLAVIRSSDESVIEPGRVPPRQMASDIVQGVRWLKNDRRAWLTIILMAGTSIVAQALILMLLDEEHSRELSALAIGIVLAASGAGGAVGSVVFRFLPDEPKGFLLPIQLAAWSVALAFLWLAGGLPAAWSAVAMFILGFTGAIGNIEFGTYLATNVADDMIARVTAIGQVLAIGACALGPVLGGYAIQRYGAKGAIEILFVIVLLLASSSLLIPEVAQKIALAFRPIRRIIPHV